MIKRNIRMISIFAALIAAVLCFSGCAVGALTPVGGGAIVTYVADNDKPAYSSVADVVDEVADTVVEINTESTMTQWGMQYIVSGAGSGVIVGRDDKNDYYYIVTNNHVISGASYILVRLRSGKEYDSAELVATDVAGDIAVVRIKEKAELNVAVWGNSDTLRIGEDLIAIGNPMGSLGGTVTKGILSATERSIAVGDYQMTLLQTDTAINPGNSGGGLFNMNGRLIGIVNAKTSDEEIEGICFAIPANTAKKLYDDLVTKGYVEGRVSLGITVTSGSTNGGAIVYVTDASKADQSGTFKQYDLIDEINGKEITSLLSYHNALAAIRPGDAVTVKVYRGTYNRFTGIRFDATPTTFTVTAKQLK